MERSPVFAARRALALAAPLALLLAANAAAAGPRYAMRVMDVEGLLGPDALVSVAGRLNDRGEVTGVLFRQVDGAFRLQGALVWDSEGDTARVVEIDGLFGVPWIDDDGRLAGTRAPGEPFLWTPESGVLGLGFSGRAEGLGEGGRIVGVRFGADAPLGVGFLWEPGLGRTDLRTLPGASSSAAHGLNGTPLVVGSSAGRATVWDAASGLRELAPSGVAGAAEALAVDSVGQIVGVQRGLDAPAGSTGILWPTPGAEPLLLPCPAPAFAQCAAVDVDDRGEILGSYGADEAEIPMLWVGGVAYDLDALLVEGDAVLQFALGINDRGQIGGLARYVRPDGTLGQAPAILTPVSEARQVRIDVKPKSDPSCFNLDGHGSVPAAILGEDDLDPRDVDPESLLLNGLVVLHRGNGEAQCEPEDVDGDGLADLVCQFEDDPERWTGPDLTATLTGSLVDGSAIEGTGAICLSRGES